MLQIPQPFGNDIQGRDTSLVPIVIIGIEHFLSIKPFFFHGQNYSPLLDPIPSLKESIDIETRKYKISNVTINIINSEYEGKRFSDHIISPNTDIIIRWVSPSATLFLDSMLIYVGKVRDYKFDDSRVTITAEDKSQSIVHVNMPINKLGVGDDVPDNYKGKPYPIVYGDVDKSPCVLKSSLEEDEFGKISGHLDIYPWFVDGNNGNIGITENLQTYHADSYMPIPSNLSSLYTEVGTDSGTGQVFSTFKGANSSIVMDETVTGYFKLLSTGNNPISNNLVPIRDYRELNELKLIGLRQEADLLNSLIDSNAGTGIDALEKNNNFTTLISGRADLSGITYEKILGSFVRDSVATVTEWDGSSLLTPIEGVDNDINPELQVAEYIDRAMPAVEVESGFVHGDFFGEILIIDYDLPVFYGNVEERYGSGTISLGIVNNLELLVSPHSENFANDTDTDVWHSTNLDSSKIFVFTDSPNSSKFTILLYLQGSGIGIKCATKIDLNKLNVIRYGLIKSPIKLDYYARAVSESSSIISI